MFQRRFVSVVALLTCLLASGQVLAQDGFDMEVYRDLEATMQRADSAQAGAEPDTDEWVDLTWESIEVRRTLIGFLSSALDAGSMDDATSGYAEDARLILIQNVMSLLVELGECEDAGRTLTLLEGLGRSGDEQYRRAYENAQISVATCRPSERSLSGVSSDEGGDTTEDPDVIADDDRDEPPIVSMEGPSLLGPMTMAGGLALVIAGGVLDFVNVGAHDDFVAARDDFNRTGNSESYATAADLADTIDGRTPWVAVLYGGGAAIAITGMVLWLLDGDDGRSDTGAVVFTGGPQNTPGAGVRISF